MLRIRILRRPDIVSIDGIRLDRFVLGHEYEVGNLVGALLLAEGWAEPVGEFEPAPIPHRTAKRPVRVARRTNLIRETFPPYFDHVSRAADTPKRKRQRRKHR